MARYKALVAGASGIVGRSLAGQFAVRSGWEVIGLSRRPPAGECPFPTLSVDLTDAADCTARLGELTGVTHLLYAGRYAHTTTAPEPTDINTAMLRNLLDAVAPSNPGLEHIHMVQGSKYYGSTLGAYKTPAKESDPRVALDHFYYAQEDLINERRRGQRWTWSCSRPHAICEAVTGISRSLGMVIAVYAAVCREEGLPFSFPGTEGNFRALYQCTEATHLAKAIAWMSTEPRCGNQAFNITNGDYIRWMNLWPVFAEYFGLKPGPVRTMRLAEVMPGKAPVWESIVKRRGLHPTPYAQTAIWSYGDFVFTPEWDIMSDTTKARRFGFGDVVDTGQMFLGLFDHYRRHQIIP
jgi:nucleoside-diphosphate-sugar epimerase